MIFNIGKFYTIRKCYCFITGVWNKFKPEKNLLSFIPGQIQDFLWERALIVGEVPFDLGRDFFRQWCQFVR